MRWRTVVPFVGAVMVMARAPPPTDRCPVLTESPRAVSAATQACGGVRNGLFIARLLGGTALAR